MISFGLFDKRVPLVRQAETAECGLACLAMISAYHGAYLEISELRSSSGFSLKGTNLGQLMNVASTLNLSSRAVRCDLEELRHIQTPAILHWDLTHFVVLESVTAKSIHILDPAIGRRTVGLSEASESFTGIVLELTPTAQLSKRRKQIRLALPDILPLSRRFWRGMGQVLILSIFLQLFILLGPLFFKLVIDEAIVKADVSLLVVIALCFAVLKIFEIAASSLRALVLQYVSAVVSYEMEAGVFHHLLQLPLKYFQRRHIGDIQQRFSALRAIQDFIVNASVSSVLDILLVIALGSVLFAYNSQLALVVSFTILCLTASQVIVALTAKKPSMEQMLHEADRQSHFLETLRGIRVVKAGGIERQRESVWKNFTTRTIGARIRLGNLQIVLGGANALILGLTNIAVVYLGARSIISGNLTLGGLVSFLAYKSILEERTTALLSVLVQLKLLDVNLERVADIVLSEVESQDKSERTFLLKGDICLENLHFSYGPNEPEVLTNVSIHIRSGEYVAFVGPSGAGKSTILNLLNGLYEPTKGKVIIDGITMSPTMFKSARSSMGVVMQDDRLLAGTIAQNISLFDEVFDEDKLRKVARIAAIENDIDSMPMGFHSLVGDMGTSLSGGQVQRIFLARALYTDPQVLIIDEGTSNLDVATERKINQNLKKLSITRIISAHRPETINSADRILLVSGAAVEERIREL